MNKQTLSAYVYQFVASLVQQGIEQVVISPGSRSTPLAYAFAHVQEVEVYRQVDERSAAFFALGLAKASCKPVVLLCTSGTAAANYFPAIVEAKYARVPLIVVTADRPHELREVGAPQAIDQIRLYGEHVKWSVDLPIPDEAPATLSFIERHVARAVAHATTSPFGPVHVNVPLREPLLIDFCELPKVTFKHYYASELAPAKEALHAIEEVVVQATNGLIVVGELPLRTKLEHLWSFVRKCKWPVLVESLSNMRGNVPDDVKPYIISTYDAILKNELFRNRAQADTVIRFGAQPVSKFCMQFIASCQAIYVVIDESEHFRDSIHAVTYAIQANVGDWLEQLQIETKDNESYVQLWQTAQRIALEEIEAYDVRYEDEGAYVSSMLKQLPSGADIFASSSMPIRDIDTFFVPTSRDIRIFANRGANGIDGVVSTALGFNAAAKRQSYLLIGDLAFLHDVNGLLATRYQHCDLTIIVMNNDGGGIFSYLPQSTVEAHYEELFGTPTALTFEKVAEMYSLQYDVVVDQTSWQAVLQAEKTTSVRLIEVRTNRETNVESHRALWQSITKRLDEWLL